MEQLLVGMFETYSKRNFKVSMVLLACTSWPWKVALPKTLQKSNSLSESIFASHSRWEFIPALISISYSAFAPNTAKDNGSPLGDTSAGHEAVQMEKLWLNWSICSKCENGTGWSCDVSPCAEKRVLLRWTNVDWIPSHGYSATSAFKKL